MEGAMYWLYGPQIIGMILLLFGFIQKTWPPKKMGGYYGYNSDVALTNAETWVEANRYAPLVMITVGAGLVAIGVLVMAVVKFVPALTPMWTQIGMGGKIVAVLIGGILMRSKTDGHIKEKFGLSAE